MDSRRNIKVYTGHEGHRIINHYFDVILHHELATLYNASGVISDEEYVNIKNMLDSEDESSHTIAFMAIKHLIQ